MAQALQARIAAFPKCYMDELCVTHSLSLFEWIEMAATLGVEGLEFYPGFFASFEQDYLEEVRRTLQRHHFADANAMRLARFYPSHRRRATRRSGAIQTADRSGRVL